ncbi:putative opsin [Clavulina sp. PMI_390]|nr:putative opsin [Clavulina sp. PMI_390]
MANASAKKTAAQNEVAIRNLQLGMLIAHGLYFLLRLIMPGNKFPPTWKQLMPYLMTAVPQLVLFRHLSTVGSPRRDVATGTLLAPGEDLSAPGITEWCFDVIYVTFACQVGSSLIGESVWWLYISIPLYAAWKLWSSIVGPMLGFKQQAPAAPVAVETSSDAELPSKKQQKAQKKADKKSGTARR